MTEWVTCASKGWIFGQEFFTWIEGIGFKSILQTFSRGFPGGSSGKESACQRRRCKRHSSIPGGPLQYSCLENSTDRGAWCASVHGVTKSWTWLGTNIHEMCISFKALLKASFLIGCWKMGRNSAARERWGKGHFNLYH